MNEQRPNSGLREGTQYLSAALRFAGATVLFLFGGLGLDRLIGTLPLFTIVGALGGAGLGFFSVYREYKADQDHPELKKWSDRPPGSE